MNYSVIIRIYIYKAGDNVGAISSRIWTGKIQMTKLIEQLANATGPD